MTTEDILDRLEEPAPLTQTELSEMINYTMPTIRKLVREEYIKTVGLEGLRNRRIPIAEARRICAELQMVPITARAKEKTATTPLRIVRA